MDRRIVVEGLEKQFGHRPAVASSHFTVEAGELFGLIGPDGAGKTTLIRMLVSLLLPTQGRAWVDGSDVVHDFKAIRKKVGYMPGRFSLYHDLTTEENLRFYATVFGTTVEENYDLIREIYGQIEPFRKRRAGALSGGMKQKLALSCALVHRPRVLFLDEPTTGVDAVSRKEFWEMLARLKEAGITILVSTPYMDEARKCDRVALMQNGRLLGVDTPSNIADGYASPLYAVRAAGRRSALIRAAEAFPHAGTVFSFGRALHVSDKRSSPAPEELRRHLEAEGFESVEVEPIPATIEDAFMALSLREPQAQAEASPWR